MDTSKFLKNADLDNLKSDVDKLDLDKVETNPVNLTLKRLVRGEGGASILPSPLVFRKILLLKRE